MSILVFPGPKSEEDILKERLKELDDLYREFQGLKAEAESLLEYHVKTGFQYADMDLINARINKCRITERVAAKKIDSYAELEE